MRVSSQWLWRLTTKICSVSPCRRSYERGSVSKVFFSNCDVKEVWSNSWGALPPAFLNVISPSYYSFFSLWHVMNCIKTKYISCFAHLTEMTKCSSRLLTKQRTDDAAVTQKHLTEGCFKFLLRSTDASSCLKPPIFSPCFCSLPPMPASHVGGTKK